MYIDMLKKSTIAAAENRGRPYEPEMLLDRAKILAEVGKGLADENRLRILLTVARGRKSVSRVVEEVDLSQPLVSHHLRELRRGHLVTVEREGPFVYYEAAGPEVLEALTVLARLVAEDDRRE
jgi:DNA-binding transcriptional ArsR family regulator